LPVQPSRREAAMIAEGTRFAKFGNWESVFSERCGNVQFPVHDFGFMHQSRFLERPNAKEITPSHHIASQEDR
jgi:hypothetical protein